VDNYTDVVCLVASRVAFTVVYFWYYQIMDQVGRYPQSDSTWQQLDQLQDHHDREAAAMWWTLCEMLRWTRTVDIADLVHVEEAVLENYRRPGRGGQDV